MPRLIAPPGACDTHIHIYEPGYAVAPTAVVQPVMAPISAYLEARARIGIERTVVVQPSAYGTDNSCLLAALEEMGPTARGVAVVDASVDDGELERLTEAGVRGIRFFMLPGGVLPWDILETMAARVHEFGWLLQLQLDGRLLPEREQILMSLPGRLVIDHVGKFLEPVPTSHPGFRSLLRLVDEGRTWVKLAAPYETSKVGPPGYNDVGTLAKALVKAAPHRMLWASNWPHPQARPTPDDGTMLDLLLDWAPNEAERHRILVDNPEELYGF